MRISILAAFALSSAIAAPAFAQEKTFEGPHIEAIGGWDNVDRGGDSKSGFVFGGAAGYDLQRGKVVFGVDAEITGSTTRETIDGARVKAGRDLYAGARLGYAVTPETLLYVKGGYSNARVTAESGNVRASDNLDGFRVGAGVERNFMRNIYGKVEYRYSNYTQDFQRHQVLAGVGVRF